LLSAFRFQVERAPFALHHRGLSFEDVANRRLAQAVPTCDLAKESRIGELGLLGAELVARADDCQVVTQPVEVREVRRLAGSEAQRHSYRGSHVPV
jgi:hypothetical protein